MSPFSWYGKGNRSRSQVTILWQCCAASLGEALESSLLMKANWSCDSVARCVMKKTFSKPSPAQYTPRMMNKVSKVVTMLGTSTLMGALPSLILGSSLLSTIWLFYQPYWVVENTMGRAYITHPMWFLDSFSYFIMTPRQYILLDSYHSSWGWQTYWFPAGVSPQHFDYFTLGSRQKRAVNVWKFWCRIKKWRYIENWT